MKANKDASEEPLLSVSDELPDEVICNGQDGGDNRDANAAMQKHMVDPTQEISDSSSDEEVEVTRQNQHYTNNCETMIHLFKANIGTGILAMPDAFKNMGLFAGIVMMAVLGLICVHCQHVLLACGKEICKRLKRRTLTYAEITENAFKSGPVMLRRFSVVARRIVNSFLIVTQLGFCCVYFLFVSSNIQSVIKNYTKTSYHVGVIMAILLPVMILYNFIKSLKTLAPISMVANVLQTVGLVIIFYHICQGLPSVTKRTYLAHYTTWPLFFGTAIYTYEGIGMVLPIENKMKTPADFRGLTGVLNTTMILIACLFCATGFYGYLKIGDSVHGSITLDLPPEPLYDAVKIMFSISVFLTYSLMLYVPVEIIFPIIENRIESPRRKQIACYVFRAFLVTFTFSLAEVIPRLDLVIALVGAVGSSTLALIFPPIIEIVTFYPDGLGKYRWKLVKDVLLCTFGLFGFVVGTYSTIAHVAKSEIGHDPNHHKSS